MMFFRESSPNSKRFKLLWLQNEKKRKKGEKSVNKDDEESDSNEAADVEIEFVCIASQTLFNC